MIDIDKLSYNENLNIAAISKDINILDILSKDTDTLVRWYVACNTNTSAETLSLLAKDIDANVRYHVAGNPNVTIEILKELINDENKFIKNLAFMRLVELKELNSFL